MPARRGRPGIPFTGPLPVTAQSYPFGAADHELYYSAAPADIVRAGRALPPMSCDQGPRSRFPSWTFLFTQATLDSLYPNHGHYVRAVQADLRSLQQHRFLTADDARALLRGAARSDVP